MSGLAQIRAGGRALVLLALVLRVPVASHLVGRITKEPRVERTEVDGVPVEVVRPPDDLPRPAWVFVNGAHPLRRKEPVVLQLTHGLARAGYVVFVPDIPGLGEGTITKRTIAATTAVTRAACERPDVRDGRVALVGASTGAGLALLAAGSPAVADRVSVVAAVAPFADLRKLVCLTTTTSYEDDDGRATYEVTNLHRLVVSRSLVAALRSSAERDRLLAEIDSIERDELDPLEELPRRAGRVGDEAGAVLALLASRDADRFQTLYEALPQSVLEFVEELSPLRVHQTLRAPVELIVPPSDAYFPLGEALALARSLPGVRLTVTGTLDHTRPRASLARLGDLAAFGGFVIRSLSAAS